MRNSFAFHNISTGAAKIIVHTRIRKSKSPIYGILLLGAVCPLIIRHIKSSPISQNGSETNSNVVVSFKRRI